MRSNSKDIERARVLIQQARDHRRAERVIDAADVFNRAIDAARAGGPGGVDLELTALTELGDLHVFSRDFAQAEPLLDRAMQLAERSAPASISHAAVLSVLASLRWKQGDHASTFHMLMHARGMLEALHIPGRPRTTYLAVLENLGGCYEESGQYAEAEQLFRELLTIIRPWVAQLSRHWVVALRQFAVVLAKRGRMSELVELLKNELAAGEKRFRIPNRDLAEALVLLGESQFHAGDPAAAESTLLRARAIWTSDDLPRGKVYGQMLSSLGIVSLSRREFEAAENAFRDAITVVDSLQQSAPGVRAVWLNNLGVALREGGKIDNAGEALEQALAEAESPEVFGPRHLHTANILKNLGQTRRLQGRLDEARSLLKLSFERLNSLIQCDKRAARKSEEVRALLDELDPGDARGA